MRIWSIHPKYLDAKGLVAVWRETLLAKHVLQNKTTGYKNHPQLTRFKRLKDPVAAIDQYLECIFTEALKRDYQFDKRKISSNFRKVKLNVTSEQMAYESLHLLKKLKVRDPKRHVQLRSVKLFDPHPMFKVVEGEIEGWEIVK